MSKITLPYLLRMRLAWDTQYNDRATPEDWKPVVSGMSKVQKVVHLAGRVDSVGQKEIADRLFKSARETYRQTIQDELNKAGCAGQKTIVPRAGRELSALRERANWAASSIANTYNLKLANEIIRIGNDTPSANRNTYAYRLFNNSDSWDKRYWAEKAQEVAEVESMTTINAGIADFYERNKGLVEVSEAFVVPFVAQCPICQEIVSHNPFRSVEAVYNQYNLPVHIGCPHSVDVHTKKVSASQCKELWVGA